MTQMCKPAVICLAFLFLPFDGTINREVRPVRRHGPQSVPYVPFVEIFQVSIDTTEIRLPVKEKEPIATVTVTVFHQNLASDQQVTLEVATEMIDPAGGMSVVYDPQTQVIRLPRGAGGSYVATVKVSQPHVQAKPPVRLVLLATLSHPSAGIRIVNDDPVSHRATITVK